MLCQNINKYRKAETEEREMGCEQIARGIALKIPILYDIPYGAQFEDRDVSRLLRASSSFGKIVVDDLKEGQQIAAFHWRPVDEEWLYPKALQSGPPLSHQLSRKHGACTSDSDYDDSNARDNVEERNRGKRERSEEGEEKEGRSDSHNERYENKKKERAQSRTIDFVPQQIAYDTRMDVVTLKYVLTPCDLKSLDGWELDLLLTDPQRDSETYECQHPLPSISKQSRSVSGNSGVFELHIPSNCFPINMPIQIAALVRHTLHTAQTSPTGYLDLGIIHVRQPHQVIAESFVLVEMENQVRKIFLPTNSLKMASLQERVVKEFGLDSDPNRLTLKIVRDTTEQILDDSSLSTINFNECKTFELVFFFLSSKKKKKFFLLCQSKLYVSHKRRTGNKLIVEYNNKRAKVFVEKENFNEFKNKIRKRLNIAEHDFIIKINDGQSSVGNRTMESDNYLTTIETAGGGLQVTVIPV
ncbi:hypothetical protein RFI_24162 [Reticulomyxa filosa]|uniref:Uncharacterized protein n=1 Tax=Reticulomyxa filosa TaxID=46433 RepID=X6MGR9_RETFI|nr:hypothetical protein RFI_24162 [Reticulomyxa filosa]|eukprot:ETO13213.1 hypothetical protein RFI_24162 [Reticulomyxa filosa]